MKINASSFTGTLGEKFKRSSLLLRFDTKIFLVKLIRAAGGCLGINRR
jgi:hypothetical protein